jgi:hypothetical protein
MLCKECFTNSILKSSAGTRKCVRNALEEPVCNRFWVPAGRFNAPRGSPRGPRCPKDRSEQEAL